MPSSTMRTAVFQATALFILSMICSHHLSENMFDQVLENERFLNMTNALNRSASLDSTNNTPGGLTLGAGDTTNKTLSFNHTIDHNNGTGINGTFSALLSNGTLINGTFSATNGSPGSAESAESFYGRRLPREVVIFMVISALQYWWFIWLERTLPARPRHREYQREEKVEESEDREEEVVKKWIAQGRVHRASLNWCNTLLKWLLELTVGRLWYHTVEHVLRVLLKFQSPKTVLEDLISHLTLNFILSITPLANLIGFIIIPAHKQIVFVAGAELVATIFFTTVVRVFANWAVKTDFVQTMMQNITDNVREMEKDRENMERFQRYKNEL